MPICPFALLYELGAYNAHPYVGKKLDFEVGLYIPKTPQRSGFANLSPSSNFCWWLSWSYAYRILPPTQPPDDPNEFKYAIFEQIIEKKSCWSI